MRLNHKIITILLLIMTVGCASNHAVDQAQGSTDPRDPIEPLNRAVWDFNYDVLDEYIVRPVTVGYVTVMPQFARTGLLNAANNLEEPMNVINNLLQGKPGASIESFSRFVINSTVGIVGLIDVASHMGIARKDEDLDEVFGVWGIENGAFVMLPAAGPTDVRGISGDVVEGLYFPDIVDFQFRIARVVIQALEARAQLMDQEQQLENSPDPYAFVKNAYFQNKAFQVTDGKSGEKEIEQQQLDDFEDFEKMLEDL